MRLQDQHWIVIADSPFLPPTGGGEQEHLGVIRAALEEGVLALLILPDGDTVELTPYRELLGDVPLLTTPRRRNPLLLLAPRTPFVVSSRPAPNDLVARARQLAPAANGILLSSYKSRAIGEALARGLGLPLVLRQQNREGPYHHALAGQTSGPQGWIRRLEAWRVERDEQRLGEAEWLTGTADISLADAHWRRGIGTPNVEHVPPFALGDRFGARADVTDVAANGATEGRLDGPPRVVFLGTLDTATNTGALNWFLDGVWPLVLRDNAEVRLDVVGRRPSAAIRRRLEQTERAELAGDVPEVAPYLERATVAVNPVVSGSGVNIKVIEYLDAGLPLVSTSLAIEGLPLHPGVDLAVHDDPAGFAGAVLDLLADQEAARTMAEQGRRHLREILDPQRNLAHIAEMLTRR